MGAATLTAVTFAGASPATAAEIQPTGISAGVPPSALMGCNSTLADTGGWLVRDVLSHGTSGTNPAPVRPRSARFYEPCFDTTGFSDAPLNIPIQLTDIPVPMVDEDGDGEDDGPPTSEPSGGIYITWPPDPGTPAFNSVENLPLSQQAISFSYNQSPGSNPGWWPLHTPVLNSLTNFYVDDVRPYVNSSNLGAVDLRITDWPTGSQSRASRIDLMCKHNTNGTLSWGLGWQMSFSTTAPSNTYTVTCNAASGNASPYKLFSSNRGAPGNTGDRVVWNSWEIDVEPEDPSGGTAWYGETQGAQYAMAASTSFTNVTYNANVVCSTDYNGTNRTVHTMPIKNPGDFDNIDRSPEPPYTDDDGNIAWSGKYNWYPTNVLFGGVYASNCPFLLEINMWVCVYSDRGPTNYGCLEQNWDSERYRTKHPYTGTDGDSPAEVICQIFPDLPGCYAVNNPDSLDGQIVCEIAAEGDFFEWIISWITLLPDWIGCMTTPEGWDRSNALGRGWEASEAGKMQRAFHNSMPSNIGCGVVANIPFEGDVITLDTCTMDVAPDWVKVVLGWVLILGLAGLSLRRILWSIGGNK